ncbi:hypothetical protein BC938DRAFT_483833, partial [Jimgerdemannia flammicorona]
QTHRFALAIFVRLLCSSFRFRLAPPDPRPLEPMNSTTDPIPSDALDTIVAAWSGVAFSALSCGIIARKALLDFTYLRCACVIVAILTLSLSSANVLRSSGMPESSFLVFQAILTTLFVDLLVGIAFSLGARLYAPAGRLNALYWTTFAVTGLMNTLEFVRLVLFLAFSPDLQSDFLLVNRVFNAIGWGFFFVALLLAFLYAFIPMIKPKTAENEMPSSLLVVIAWYLTGLSVLCLLHIIPFGIFAAYPEHYNKDVNIKATTVLIFLRFLLIPAFRQDCPRHPSETVPKLHPGNEAGAAGPERADRSRAAADDLAGRSVHHHHEDFGFTEPSQNTIGQPVLRNGLIGRLNCKWGNIRQDIWPDVWVLLDI